MPFDALVVRVLIASPSDTGHYRKLLKETVEDWNSLHGEDSGVMLHPVMWERDATPEVGERPQAIINRQLVDAADVLVGVFWTRLGTPTSEAESGTAEEVELFVAAGKPVLLYFSSQPVVPDTIDKDQLERLRAFRDSLGKRGLFDRFELPEELSRKVTAALTMTVREHFQRRVHVDPDAEEKAALERPNAALVASVGREREMTGISRSGSPKYRTRERLIIENRGTGVAEDVGISVEPAGGGEGHVPAVAGADQPLTRLPPGGAVEYPLMSYMGMVPQWEIVFRWREDGRVFEERQSMR